MTPELLINRLVNDGALIADGQMRGMRTLPIHAEFVTPAPNQDPPAVGWLYWVEAGAQDQHHTHFRAYAKVEVIHDRDLHLTNAHGENVAYVAPLEQWPQTDVQGMKARLAQARLATEATASHKSAFDAFVQGCRPDPADALAALPSTIAEGASKRP